MALKINGQIVQLASPDNDIIIELDNSEDRDTNVEFRLSNLDQADPAGRFRMRVNGDALEFQRATLPDWADAATLITIDGADQSVVLELPDDDQLSLLQQVLVELQQLRTLIDMATG